MVRESPNARLIVTTCVRDFFNPEKYARSLDVGTGMAEDEGVKLLKSVSSEELEEKGLVDLVREVDGMPLAISHIGLYMGNEYIHRADDYQKYKESYRYEIKSIAEQTLYGKSVFEALLLPISKIATLNKDAFEILVFASLLHPDAIKEEFFKDYLQEKYPYLPEANITDILSKSLKLIKDHSLIKTESGLISTQIIRHASFSSRGSASVL